MILQVKSQNKTHFLIALSAATLLPLTVFAKSKPIMTTDLLQHLRKGEPWDRGVFASTKMVMFKQAPTTTTGATNANVVSKVTLSYFTTNNCTAANGTTVPNYTTPNGSSFTISTSSPFTAKSFGMVAESAWNVGNTLVSPTIAAAYPGKDINNILSIAVTLKSTNNNTPQASFTGISFACVPVTCSSGACISSSGTTQSFQLKTTAAIGDPADGGVIACMTGGLNNLVVPTADNSTSIQWGGIGTATTATSTSNGANNTTIIVTTLGSSSSYAARICSTYSAAGGYTNSWFLPATLQLNCLNSNNIAIANGATVSGGSGFSNARYWSSTDSNSTVANYKNLINGNPGQQTKTSNSRARCARAFAS